jgi:hypothetical protein
MLVAIEGNMGVLTKAKIIVYASPDQIATAKGTRVAIEKLNALYGCDKTEAITQKIAELNLSPGTIMRIANALIYRNEHGPKAASAIEKIEDLGNALPKSPAFRQLIQGMQALESKFLAMYSAEQLEQATHHSLSHGVDMTHDPSDFIAPILKTQNGQLTPASLLMMTTLHVLGAAHDIIQGKLPPPRNEIESAEWFCIEMKKMLDDLIQNNKEIYSETEINALHAYKVDAVPFLAREGIINATYLLFSSGKRDFDNVLTQISEIYLGDAVDLTPMIAAMKIGLSTSDTRRGEMDHLLEKMESLSLMLDRQQDECMNELLRAAGVFTVEDALPKHSTDLKNLSPAQKEKCKNAEGFLLRLRPSLNMAIEIAKKTNVDESGNPLHDETGAVTKVPDPVGATIIRQLRMGQEPKVDFGNRVELFLAKIHDRTCGEVTFANALGEINSELVEHAERYGISSIMKNNHLREEWKSQGALLVTLKNNMDAMESSQKAAIAKLMYTMAAISPGLIIGMGMTQEIYDGLVKYEQDLFNQSGASDKLKKLSRDITEVETLNPEKLKSSAERPAIGRVKQADVFIAKV